MELDISTFFTEAAPMDYAASRAEIGQDAGPTTWRHACEDSEEYPLLQTDEQRERFRRYVKGFGAWSEEEIARWSDTELNALCIQMIAGDMREANLSPDASDDDWREYQRRAERGNISGRISRSEDGKVYYYVGE
jgi:hypothetical protein